MTVKVRPLAETTREAMRLLFRDIGPVETIRFLNQFATGYGNYTEERDQLFADMTLDEIIAEIKRNRRDVRK
jgi:hypothetical protein